MVHQDRRAVGALQPFAAHRKAAGHVGHGQHLGRRAARGNRSLAQQQQVVAVACRRLQVVQHQQRGQPLAARQLAHPLQHGELVVHVQCTDRLVQQQQARLRDQGLGQEHHLALATAELRQVAAGECGNIQRLQHDPHRVQVGRLHAQAQLAQPAQQHDLQHGQRHRCLQILRHVADRGRPGRRIVEAQRAAARQHARDGLDQRGLARAVWPDDAGDPARRALQAHALHRAALAVAHAEILDLQLHQYPLR